MPTLARADVSALAKFDTLTGGYKVVAACADGAHRSQSERRDQEAEVRDWLTTFDQVALDPVTPLEPNAEYYVHVRADDPAAAQRVAAGRILPFGREEITRPQTFTFIK